MKNDPDLKTARCKDPCDYVMRYGGDAFQRIIDHAVPVLDFKWKALASTAARDSIFEKREKVADFVKFLSQSDIDPIKHGLMLKRLSELSGMDVGALRGMLDTHTWLRKPVTATARASGRDLAEAWLLGCLLVQPTLYRELDTLHIHLFQKYRPLAARLMELWEESDLAALPLVDVLAFLEGNDEAVSQVIDLEARIDHWRGSTGERGVTIEGMARDVLATLAKPVDRVPFLRFTGDGQ